MSDALNITALREAVAKNALLRSENDRLTNVVIPHARKQEHANGFQCGWHAALLRIREGDTVDALAELVPKGSS